jgi:hypothetical protein
MTFVFELWGPARLPKRSSPAQEREIDRRRVVGYPVVTT